MNDYNNTLRVFCVMCVLDDTLICSMLFVCKSLLFFFYPHIHREHNDDEDSEDDAGSIEREE